MHQADSNSDDSDVLSAALESAKRSLSCARQGDFTGAHGWLRRGRIFIERYAESQPEHPVDCAHARRCLEDVLCTENTILGILSQRQELLKHEIEKAGARRKAYRQYTGRVRMAPKLIDKKM